MVAILSAVVSIFAFRFRGRAALELELVALRHQVTVLRRQRPGRPQLSSLDRLLWVWLYRIWPQIIDAMVLVKPATVVQLASQRVPASLALAITPSGTTQDRHRNP
jgi:putative transposase